MPREPRGGGGEWEYHNPPKCRKCQQTICPNVWACCNPECEKNLPKPKKASDGSPR